jgi:hypothetical protein
MSDRKDTAVRPEDEALIAALMTLYRRGIPTDIQAMLVYGDNRGIAPGALAAALAAATEAFNNAKQAIHGENLSQGSKSASIRNDSD